MHRFWGSIKHDYVWVQLGISRLGHKIVLIVSRGDTVCWSFTVKYRLMDASSTVLFVWQHNVLPFQHKSSLFNPGRQKGGSKSGGRMDDSLMEGLVNVQVLKKSMQTAVDTLEWHFNKGLTTRPTVGAADVLCGTLFCCSVQKMRIWIRIRHAVLSSNICMEDTSAC